MSDQSERKGSLTSDQLVARIKRKLGYPTLDLELTDDQIRDAVDDAFNRLYDYIVDEEQYITVLAANAVDLSDYGVEYVTNVFQTPSATDLTDVYDTSIFDPSVSLQIVKSTTNLIENFVEYSLYKQSLSNLKDSVNFRFIPPILYVDQGAPKSPSIVIEYQAVIKSVDDIHDRYWSDLVYRLALALTKETLGRIRSAVKVSGAPYELDGDTLLSEAKEEISSIKEEVDQIAYGYFPID